MTLKKLRLALNRIKIARKINVTKFTFPTSFKRQHTKQKRKLDIYLMTRRITFLKPFLTACKLPEKIRKITCMRGI